MDRRRGTASETGESDKPYLDKCGLLNHIKGLLTKLIENRPKDVVEFMADYFDCSSEKTDRVSKACQQVSLVHYSKHAHQNNVQIAYDILCQNKGAHQSKVLAGGLYMEFLTALCRQLPASAKDKLIKKLSCREHEVVVFSVFKSSVFICLVLHDFMMIAEEIYATLNSNASEGVDGLILEVIVNQLREAVNKSFDHPYSLLEAGYLLAPDRVYLALATAMFRGGASKSKCHEDFVADCAEIFISKVSSLR